MRTPNRELRSNSFLPKNSTDIDKKNHMFFTVHKSNYIFFILIKTLSLADGHHFFEQKLNF